MPPCRIALNLTVSSSHHRINSLSNASIYFYHACSVVNSINSDMLDDTKNNANHTTKININDRSLHNKALSFAWVPATRRLVTVCWGQVWYWDANAAKKTLTLADQDGVDINLRTSGISSVISSLTKIGVENSGSSSGGGKSKNKTALERLSMPSKTIDPLDDCVILICGEPPHAKLLRIELVKHARVSAIECKLDDVVKRSSTGFCCGSICGEYCLIGCSNGEIMVVDLDTFKFVPSLTIGFPDHVRGELDLRARTLTKMKNKSRMKNNLPPKSSKGKRGGE